MIQSCPPAICEPRKPQSLKMKHAPSKPELARLYEKRSKRYDFTANLYYLIGFREFAYRRLAIEVLRLKTAYPGSVRAYEQNPRS